MFGKSFLFFIPLYYSAIGSQLNETLIEIQQENTTALKDDSETIFENVRGSSWNLTKNESSLSNMNEVSESIFDLFDQPTLNDYTEIWNPYKVMRFWNSDTSRIINTSVDCGQDITEYMVGLSRREQWALKMVDATGKYTWGLFSGNQFWLGALDQCRAMERDYLKLRNKKNSRSRKDVIPPFLVSVTSVTFTLEIFQSELRGKYDITLGLCLPYSCDAHDVKSLLSINEDHTTRNISRRINILKIRNLSKGYTVWEDTTFYVLLIFVAVTSLLVLLGTLYDIFIRYHTLYKEKKIRNDIKMIAEMTGFSNKNEAVTDEDTMSKFWPVKEHFPDARKPSKPPNLLSEILLSFSVPLNISKIFSFSVGEHTLAPIHGLKFFSMLWILLGHTCLTAYQFSESTSYRSDAEDNILYQTISNATYAVDTFFLISGCLVSYLYFRTIKQDDMKRVKLTRGFLGQIVQYIGMMLYRYFRLTFPYFISLLYIRVVSKSMRDHLILDKFQFEYKNCDKVMWMNLLYINNYYPKNEYNCCAWSWYLTNDTQFYAIGIIILIIGASIFPVAAFITILLLIASWITTAILAVKVNHVPSIQDPFANYESLYNKPWTRIGPYLIGMMIGWYLYKIGCKVKLNKAFMLVCWAFSAITLINVVYGLYGNTFGPTLSIIYTTFSHSGFALCIGWILIACVCGYGGWINTILSWKYLFPLSRLSYCVYLVHPLLMRIILMDAEDSMHLSHGLMATLFFGFTVASYIIALVVSLLFEAPVVSLLRIIHPLRMFKQEKRPNVT